jgi:hypothetical protein
MDLVVDARGGVRAVYSEMIDLRPFGRPAIARASNVEPTPDGRWTVDLRPVVGPVLGPFAHRSEALAAAKNGASKPSATEPPTSTTGRSSRLTTEARPSPSSRPARATSSRPAPAAGPPSRRPIAVPLISASRQPRPPQLQTAPSGTAMTCPT